MEAKRRELSQQAGRRRQKKEEEENEEEQSVPVRVCNVIVGETFDDYRRSSSSWRRTISSLLLSNCNSRTIRAISRSFRFPSLVSPRLLPPASSYRLPVPVNETTTNRAYLLHTLVPRKVTSANEAITTS